MVLQHDAVGQRFVGEPHEWTSRDAMLYALSVGAGAEDAAQELRFTTENSAGTEQAVLPTFATVLSTRVPWELIGDFPLTRILHGEQSLTLHGTLPTSGAVVPTNIVEAIEDKGANAAVRVSTQLHDVVGGHLVAELHRTVIIRGEGGFGGHSGAPAPWHAPERAPDAVVRYPTRVDQALLYRLNGDRHPLHSDPAFAANAGFVRPILHGLCTYAFAGRALLHTVCDSDVDRFGSMSARFAAPVLPGAHLETVLWAEPEAVLFQTKADGVVVLDRGVFRRRLAA